MITNIRDNRNTAGGFIGYEYKEVTASRDTEALIADGYQNFGWELEGTGLSASAPLSYTMKFKRDRKLRGKAELNRLQRQFDVGVQDIETLKRSQTTTASIVAYVVGIIGAAFMAGSVFAVTGGMITLCVILAVPAFIGWIVPYFAYKRLRDKKTAQVEPVIDRKLDELYDLCEKGNALLAGEA